MNPDPNPTNGDLSANSRSSERMAAAERSRSYPYRFPRDFRRLGGKFSVEENGRRLLRFFYWERRLMQAQGAWTLSIPEFEVKLETGRHIFYHADVARSVRERLHEQEFRLADIDNHRDADIDRFIEEMLSGSNPAELLVGVHQVAGRALEIAYRHHIDDTDAITDAPTIRLLRRALTDYEPMLQWAEQAIAAYIDGGVDEASLTAWRWHLQRLLGHLGGVTGADAFVANRYAAPAFSAPVSSPGAPMTTQSLPTAASDEPKLAKEVGTGFVKAVIRTPLEAKLSNGHTRQPITTTDETMNFINSGCAQNPIPRRIIIARNRYVATKFQTAPVYDSASDRTKPESRWIGDRRSGRETQGRAN